MTVIDSHFSNFADGGSLVAGNIVVGLKNGVNTKFVFDGGIGTFLPLAGGTMSGAINMDGNLIINSGSPSAPGDLTNKAYVDSVVGAVSPLTTKGDIWVYSTINTRLAVGTLDGQILQVSSGAATGLAYSTATYPVSTTANQLLYSSASNVISGLASNPNSVLITDISGIPSTGSTLPAAVQSNITMLGTQVQALNMGSHLINNVTDPVSAQDAMTLHYAGLTYLALAGGTMAGNINMGGFKATNAADPLNPQDYATKFYVDQNSLTGTSVYAATTGSLGTVTQSGAGVGATLTNAGVQATFALDGVNPPLNSVVLIKDNATGMTAANQGIYTVSDVGSGATNWVLTRSTTYDTPTEINQTGLIIVQNGSTLMGTAWYNAATIVTVDTTSFNYNEFGNIVFPITLAHGGTNANITASAGAVVYCTATEFALSAVGSSGQLFQSAGTSAPGWTTATYPTTSGASGKIMQSNGTNWIASTATWPTAATNGKFVIANGTNYVESTSTIPTSAGSTAGKVLASDGTNYVLSSFAFPTSVGATGTLLRSDGTNWVATTATYPATTTINRILFSSSNNVIGEISTVVSAGLLTNGSGVPAWVTATGTGAPVLGTAPTISSPKIDTINDQANNLPVMQFSGVASAVNYFTVQSSATGTQLAINGSGSDTNINLLLGTKGTGSFIFANAGGGANILTLTGVASGVNYLNVTNGATGVAPFISAVGSNANIAIEFHPKNDAPTSFFSNGVEGFRAYAPASGVNYIQAKGSVTTSGVELSAQGTDTNIDFNIYAKGSGGVVLVSRSTAVCFTATASASAVNYIGVNGSATGVATQLAVAGSDSNISMNINSKGTGRVAIQGISTNTAAAAGYIGEYMSASNVAGSPITFTTGVAKTLQSLTLTAGDWDVGGNIFCIGTTVTTGQVGIGTANNTMPDNSLTTYSAGNAAAVGGVAPIQQKLISASTTYYLVGLFTGTGTLSASGLMWARRRS